MMIGGKKGNRRVKYWEFFCWIELDGRKLFSKIVQDKEL
jgi:hypothetical protein